MGSPPIDYLSHCLVTALLDFYQVDKPPVPVRRMIASPPPDLARDLTLVEVPGLPFRSAEWLRLHDGQGRVFVDVAVPMPQRRYAMARAFFIGFCSSRGGRTAGLNIPLTALDAHAMHFGRCLLMPSELLPRNWQYMTARTLAQLFEMPVTAVEMRLKELTGNPSHSWLTN
jgi:hypothetical protein